MHPNMKAFLDMIAFSEIGHELLKVSNNGYDVIVGSTAAKPILFNDYSHHPRSYQPLMNSDAAGRYQFMGVYWEPYRKQLSLPDFGPESQDKWAQQLIRECGAVGMIENGLFPQAVHACRSRWASLPGAGYGQHENALAPLQAVYIEAGGTVA
jgi:muramidase (phage lysozyme)